MTETYARGRVFSGIQPTGKLHFGNYLGALSLWAEMRRRRECIFCIADLHAVTVPGAVSPERLRQKICDRIDGSP